MAQTVFVLTQLRLRIHTIVESRVLGTFADEELAKTKADEHATREAEEHGRGIIPDLTWAPDAVGDQQDSERVWLEGDESLAWQIVECTLQS